MPPLSTVAAAALTMALTVGPTAATAEPVSPDSRTSNCAESPTLPESADLTRPLSADELREAAELIEQARELVAKLSGLVGNPRATAVEHTLRGAGFTVRGHEKVPAGGQVQVPAGGRVRSPLVAE